MTKMNEGEKLKLLPALGRIGGPAAWNVVEVYLADGAEAVRAAAIKALCNWPDGSVAPRGRDGPDVQSRRTKDARRCLDPRRPAARRPSRRAAAGHA